MRFFCLAVKTVSVRHLSNKSAAGYWIAVMRPIVGDAALVGVAGLGVAEEAAEGVAGGPALFQDGVRQGDVVAHQIKGRRRAPAPGCTRGLVFQPGRAQGGQPAVALG